MAMLGTRRPQPEFGESIADYLKRLEEWEEQGEWRPASGGTEEPFTARSGHKLLYCYQARTGKHAYLDCSTDTILTDEEARTHLGTY